ncbi:MAG: hypothetical protein JEZ11_07845 [Desulfobacterales bacterium]|nr:hypothetical protein [Desulfobacterales bacterium]
MANTFKSRVWVSEGNRYRFEEIESGRVKPDLGICFSGGGTRAMAAAMGQLRAVCAMNRLAAVDYIACVSGGSWASTIFTYIQDDAISDQALVGTPTAPESITVEALTAPMPETCLGYGATCNFLCAIVKNLCLCLKDALSADRVWIDAVGQTLFAPFGISDTATPCYYSLNQEAVDRIVAANPTLSQNDFIWVRRENRPYLVVNSAMVGPSGKIDHKKMRQNGLFPDLVGFEYTPLYVGSPAENRSAFSEYDLSAGNGFIEPFAFGGPAPSGPVAPDGTQEVPMPAEKFTITDASGTSSAAYGYTVAVIDHILGFARSVKGDLDRIQEKSLDAAAVAPEAVRGRQMLIAGDQKQFFGGVFDLLEHIHDCVKQAGIMPWWRFLLEFIDQAENILAGLLPQQTCWPVTREGGQQGADFDFTDGGNMENYGIISLLLRGVETIVVYINTSTKMEPGRVFNGTGGIDFKYIDSTLASLFGYAPKGLSHFTGNLGHNQVFDPAELKAVVDDFAACMGDGASGKTCREPLVSVQTHTTKTPAEDNWWGVENGRRVQVCWVYLSTPESWYHALAEPVQGLMKEKEFSDFPFYRTIGEDDGQLVMLSPEQVRLLAHLTCWTTMNSEKIKSLFAH